MERLSSTFSRLSKFWKRKHMTQMAILAMAVSLLGILIFFYVFSSRADISTLEAGLAQSTVIYDQRGEIASKISANRNEGVPISKIPDDLKNAVIAIEDQRFYSHNGIDLIGIARAFFRNITAGGIVEGGSTITQQLTKNALLSPEKTYKRKAEELFLARKIEQEYSKDEILEMYFNQIYFGEGAWGINSAAAKYFGKEPEALTISESAMLAGIIKAPSAWNPYKDFEQAVDRRNTVLAQMKENKFITNEQYSTALSEEILLNDKGEDPFHGQFPHYVDHVFAEAIEEYGLTQDELLTGGYEIYTELDPGMQSAVETAYQNDSLFPEGSGDEIVQSGAVLLDPATGGIRALVGGRGDHVFRAYNRATELKAQPGSTMKPLSVYVPALENGWSPEDMLKDEKMKFGDYEPHNYTDIYLGEVPMYEAVKESLNLPAVWLLNELGIESGMDAAERFGIPLKKEDRNLGLALGGLQEGVSPLMMAEAYSAFANGGNKAEAHAITKIIDADGKTIGEWKEKTTKVRTKAVSDKMTTMLLGVVEDGTGKEAQIEGRDLAGKTGSTEVPIEGINGVKDQWFVGYTPQLAGAVWVGYDHTDESHYLTTTSSEGAALVFKNIISSALQGTEPAFFNVPRISDYEEKSRRQKFEKELEEFGESIKKEKGKWKDRLKKEAEKWEKKRKNRGEHDDD
ncbi:transglycosylase domain-containing protein [Bacillus sp. V33-4]|uniref:transglycosylase domain-containing protein n=1 Tax=Bacillus sp. V33-4 TaxID=2054169 RepID=UPI000C76F1B0|nr:penicillin-binding protein 1A [Bacillus sp. V33-4]PLR86632.1 penicillin-binding protein [Bacillus sp. V33-4]